MGCHYLNTIEAAMAYCIWMTKADNSYLRDLLRLFKHHQICYDKMKVRRNNLATFELSSKLFLLFTPIENGAEEGRKKRQ